MSSQSSIGDFGQDEADTETPDTTLDACMAGSLSDWFCGQCGSGEVAFHPTGIESMPDSPLCIQCLRDYCSDNRSDFHQ